MTADQLHHTYTYASESRAGFPTVARLCVLCGANEFDELRPWCEGLPSPGATAEPEPLGYMIGERKPGWSWTYDVVYDERADAEEYLGWRSTDPDRVMGTTYMVVALVPVPVDGAQ